MKLAARHFAGVMIAAAAALLVPPASAEEPQNWMREYVQLRNEAFLTGIFGPETSGRTATPRIINGTKADPDDNPFQVALLQKRFSDNYYDQFCGGTLYKRIYVITAAHCSDFVTPRMVDVLTNTRKLDGSGVRHHVVKVTVHPDWNPNTKANDVAVWKLATPGPDIPVVLADRDPPVGTKLLATGWGSTRRNTFKRAVALRQVRLPVTSRNDCNDGNSYNGRIRDTMICAGYDGGGKDTCQGDSGGPLTHDRPGSPEKFKVLVGITSFGNGCAKRDFFGVYARVSHPSIQKFIKHNTP